MQITINNFRKVEKAVLEVSKITLVGGHNEAGKTSVSQAIGAAIIGNANVLGVAKKEALKLVRDGSKHAAVHIVTPDGEIKMGWPSMEVDVSGNPPRASEFAVGARRFTSLEKQEAAGVISKLMKAEPTEKDFKDIAIPLMGEKGSNTLWEMIVNQGWDATYSYVQESARNLKAEWKVITSDQWGSKKSETWMPEGYSIGLQDGSEEEYDKLVKAAQKALEEAIAANAVTVEKVNSLKATADKYPELAKRKADLDAKIAEAQTAYDQAQHDMDDAPQIPPEGLICPHCKGAVTLVGKSLTKAGSDDHGEREHILKARTQKTEARNQCKANLDALQRDLANLIPEGKAAQKAKKELEQLGATQDTVTEAEAERKINGFRDTVAMQQRQLEAFKKWKKAGTIHTRILTAISMGDEVAPSGIRQRKAGEAVEAFNTNHLYPLCQAFGISPVTLSLDMDVLYRSHQYHFLSESAKFRVNAILQVAIARLDKSQLLVLDGADVIVGKDRSGLMNLLLYSKIPAVVCLSLSKQEFMPVKDIANVGGKCYWLENSVAVPLEA